MLPLGWHYTSRWNYVASMPSKTASNRDVQVSTVVTPGSYIRECTVDLQSATAWL